EFLPYIHRVRVRHGSRLYPFPINLLTLHEVFGVTTPAEAAAVLESERLPFERPANLEEFALSQIGERLYRQFVYGYTKKQWGREPRELPVSILRTSRAPSCGLSCAKPRSVSTGAGVVNATHGRWQRRRRAA